MQTTEDKTLLSEEYITSRVREFLTDKSNGGNWHDDKTRQADLHTKGVDLYFVGGKRNGERFLVECKKQSQKSGKENWLNALGQLVTRMSVTYLMVYFICEKNESNLVLKQEQRMQQDSREMLKITQKSLFDMRTIVHDTKNTYAYILMLLEEGKTKELKNYLNSISGEVLKSLSYIEGSNSVVVNILNMELAKAEAHGFKLKTVLNVPPALPYSENDLCSIFTNLIDNAIEACERYKFDSSEIHVVAAIRQDYFYIEVSNPLPEGTDVSKLMLLNTAKNNSDMHGFGTKIVKKIADKYDGYVNFEVDGNNFIVEVMLGLMVDSDENV